MENNLMTITQRVHTLIHQLAPVVTGENAEMEIIHAIAEELLEEMGEIEQYDNVKKALVNMFICGQLFPNKNK